MLKVVLGYPSISDERKVVDGVLDDLRREVQPVLEPAQLEEMKQTAASIYLDDKVKDYVLDLVSATRHPEKYKLSELKSLIQYGASPRASINLCLAARAQRVPHRGALYVTPRDGRRTWRLDILRHSCASDSTRPKPRRPLQTTSSARSSNRFRCPDEYRYA